ncbi:MULTISPECIES: hypothetical protein [Niveibacterium]|uniref:Lipoprotein n=1 Tax=Niveibacterium microcysteis TaxID=2811415 RepID=A0ABX7MAH8_9RHOO|nr:hypothetical protein [Niveibacterium microcysteis]QSI78756.1 hypothetical protein JY500_09190 [Niveibacterium microcysteis]
MRTPMLVLLLGALGACSSIKGDYPSTPLIPNAAINVADGLTIALEDIVAGAAVIGVAYYVIDPLAPNWTLRAVRLDEDRYRIAMRMKRFHMGGEGEAMQLFKRQAEDMVRAQGYSSYTIARYEEGQESNWISERVASGDLILRR